MVKLRRDSFTNDQGATVSLEVIVQRLELIQQNLLSSVIGVIFALQKHDNSTDRGKLRREPSPGKAPDTFSSMIPTITSELATQFSLSSNFTNGNFRSGLIAKNQSGIKDSHQEHQVHLKRPLRRLIFPFVVR